MTEPPAALQIFAVAAPGVEDLLAAELRALGLDVRPVAGGAEWTGGMEDVHLANLHSRLATRVLVRVAEFRARTFFELERHARRIPWERFLAAGGALHLRVSCRKSKLYHEGAVAQRLLRAAEEAVGPVRAPSAVTDEEGEPGGDAQLLVVRFLHDRCTVSADTSGEPLYRRGYRQAVARAPLRETLAASMLAASGWTREHALLDPMCGSGTIPIEAALLARDVAPGIANAALAPRRYAFEEWPGHDAHRWGTLVEHARGQVRKGVVTVIHGSDRDAGAIEAATENARRAGVLNDLRLERAAVTSVQPPTGPGWLLFNPPYGVRVSENSELRNLYSAIGRFARASLAGWRIGILAADPRLAGQLRIPLKEALRTRNGGIPVQLLVGDVE